MKQRRALYAVVPLLAILLVAWVTSAGASQRHQVGKVIWVVEHAATDKTTDLPPKGDSAGDILTFHNKVFNRAGTRQVGKDQGVCTRIAKGASYECIWTIFLKDGQITVEGPFYDAAPSVLAITGGTGAYAGARGSMALKAIANGTRFNFVYRLLG